MFWIGGHHFIQAMEVVLQDLDASQKVKKPIIGWHLNYHFNIWNIRHWKLMKVGFRLWFKQNSKLWNNIVEQHMEFIIAFKEGATM
jgi:hypothetical protein